MDYGGDDIYRQQIVMQGYQTVAFVGEMQRIAVISHKYLSNRVSFSMLFQKCPK